MNKCKNCDVNIACDSKVCPLCKNQIEGVSVISNTYPKITFSASKYNLILKIYAVLSILGILVSIIVNLLTLKNVLWSLICIAGILYSWSVINHVVSKNYNVASKILVQTLTISLLIIAIDYAIGFSGWSVNFVIPSLTITANVTILILVLVNRMKWRNYVRYQMVMLTLGFIPIILYLLDVEQVMWTALVSAIVSLVILLVTIIFSDRNVKNELKRRIHI